jgi:glutamate N-acetyltransferase/amino-acid N-acetyltransferase
MTIHYHPDAFDLCGTDYIVPGFKSWAVKAGIRGRDRLDLGLIVSDVPAVAAGVFTTSMVKAAPVLLDLEHLKEPTVRAILVNSGVANACSGEQGMAFARATAKLTAAKIGCPATDVLVCSTGVIGEQLDLAWFEKGVPALVPELSAEGFAHVACGFMTTDLVPKIIKKTVELDGREISIVGMAKGAGMIMPNMATMLGFVLTDAAISADACQELLRQGADQSFNVITVDGDTSTNDTVLLLANGVAGNTEITDLDSGDGVILQEAVDQLMKELALKIVADGEGATKLITVKVAGSKTRDEALQIGKTIANSPLFKTACFGEDANWGRIFAAAGRAGVDFDQTKTDIFFDDVQMVQNGLGLFENEEDATKVLKQEQFTVTVDLHQGDAACEVYTCDFSHEYVTINGDYRT